SMAHIIWNVLRHPSRVWSLAFQHGRLHYYVQLLGPVAGLAFLAPATLFLAVPTLLVNVGTIKGIPTTSSISTRHSSPPGSFLPLSRESAAIGVTDYAI